MASADKVSTVTDMVEDVAGNESKQSKNENYQSQSGEKVKFSHYYRIFSYATNLDACLLLVGCAASIGAGVTLPLMNIVFGSLVGGFNGYFTPGSSVSKDSFNASLDRLTLYLVYLWIGKFVLCYLAMVSIYLLFTDRELTAQFTFRIAGLRISAAIRLAYIRAVFSQSISVLDKLPPGQTAATITAKANLLQLGISEKLSTGLQAIALVVGAYAVAFRYSWKLTLVTSSVLLFVSLVYTPMIPVMLKLLKSKDHADERSTSIASEVIGSIRMVVACGAEDRVASRYRGWVEESRRRGLKISPWLGLQLAPMFFSIFADFALTFWFGVRLYIQGGIADVSTVLIVLMSVVLSVTSLGRIVPPLLDMSKAAGAASNFFTMIDAPTLGTDGLTETEVSSRNDIVLENVTFAYPSRPHVKALDGLSMLFETGKLTAIVGPSGSGKSTVVGLLQRWYELGAGAKSTVLRDTEKDQGKDRDYEDDVLREVAPSGTIFIGQHDITHLNLKWWRSQIGLVEQSPYIFNDTIYKNVSHGLVGSRFEKVDEATKQLLIQEACREANADEFMRRLPMGLETTVGDGGIKLSGGQRQRIAIARSIIKQPQILILDEATAAIDVRGERIVLEALNRVSKRTTIIIAHRLSTIRRADRIVVLAKGSVVEQGTHDELLSKMDGAYFKLVSAQNLSTKSVDTDGEAIPGLNEYHRIADDADDECAEPVPLEPWNTYQPRGVFGSFGLMLSEQRKHFPWLGAILLGCLGTGASMPLQSYLFAKCVTIFSLPGQALSAGSKHWSLLFFILAIVVGIAYFIVGWASNSFAMHVSSFYRQEYFSSIIHQPIAFFDAEGHSAGTLISRLSRDPLQLEEMMGLNMAFMVTALFTIVGCVAIAFSFGWKLTVITLFASLPISLAASWYRIRFEVMFEKMNAAVFAESSKFAAEAIGAFRTVTSLTLEDFISDRYASLLGAHIDEAVEKAWGSTLVFALSDSVNLLCIALTFWAGGRFLASMEYTPLQFLVIYVAIIQGSESAGQWMSFGPNISAATAASNRILGFRTKTAAKQMTVMAIPPPDGGAEIEFHNVHFKYPTRDNSIFCGLDFSIKAGQFAAFVGPSGCGKTTIVSLIEQFYTIQRGVIRLDGVDIADVDLVDYRQVFGLVAQEAGLLEGTIRDNILMAVNKNPSTEEDLHQACRDAEIHEFIMSLPEGYETDIGSRGVALSGGQKQRIAIARALIRKPRVLLLDEASSSLDTRSEKLVQASFERAGKGRTMIAIAHRLSTISKADSIFVLGSTGGGDGASILEKGTHQELLKKRGVYWQMCESQALDR